MSPNSTFAALARWAFVYDTVNMLHICKSIQTVKQNLHSVKRHNLDNSKGKVVLGDIGLWTSHCTKRHRNTISHSHLITHYVSGGWIFTGNYILWHEPHFGIIFDSHAITARSAFVHKVWALQLHASHRHEGDAKSSKWWPGAPNPWPFEPKIIRL